MKKPIVAMACTLLLAAIVHPVQAGMRTVEIEYSYAGIEPTGFRLYREGVAVCQINNGTARQMSCQVEVTIGANSFTLTALQTPYESRHSDNYIAYWAGDTDVEQKRLLKAGDRDRQPTVTLPRGRQPTMNQTRSRQAPSPGRDRLPAAPGAVRSRNQ